MPGEAKLNNGRKKSAGAIAGAELRNTLLASRARPCCGQNIYLQANTRTVPLRCMLMSAIAILPLRTPYKLQLSAWVASSTALVGGIGDSSHA